MSLKIETPSFGRTFVYLTYLDESETKAKIEHWKVVCAVLVRDDSFGITELLSSFAIDSLMPEDRRADFQEFHACEIYGGYGPFEGIDQKKRFDAIEYLLDLVTTSEMKVTYGAVDLDYLRQQPFASANPLDMAFRLCAKQVGDQLNTETVQMLASATPASQVKIVPQFALFIVDQCDKSDKAVLQNSFRSMRKRVRPPEFDPGLLASLHDDMYFGDSRYSIGIQIADLCAYFVARHLSKDDETERFYKMIEPRIFSSETQGQ